MDTFHTAVILVLISAAWACSSVGFREVFMDEMAHDSNIIAYGVVTDKFPYKSFSYSFSVEFQVKCSYKGGALPSKINISYAGYMPGMCGYKNFTVGMEYIVFLSHYDSRYEQIYDKTMEASSSMAELLSFCGLQMDYPSDGINIGQCQEVQKDSCKEYTPPRNIHPPPPPVNKEGLPPPVFGDEEGSGDLTTPASKTEMTSLVTEKDTTSVMSSMVESKTMSAVKTSFETPAEKRKSTEIIIVPIVTPESRDEPDKPRAEYGAVNDGTGNSGNSGNRIVATTLQLLTAMLLLRTLN